MANISNKTGAVVGAGVTWGAWIALSIASGGVAGVATLGFVAYATIMGSSAAMLGAGLGQAAAEKLREGSAGK